MSDDKEARTRRRVLKTFVFGGSAALSASVLVPVLEMALSPARQGGEAGGHAAGKPRWIATVRFDSLVDGEPKRIAMIADQRDAWTLEKAVELGAVWLVKRGDKVEAFNVACPHLGCSVSAHPGGAGFNCACHDSNFAIDGQRQNGPSPRALDLLATKVEQGVVMVDFRRFRQGTPEKVEIG